MAVTRDAMCDVMLKQFGDVFKIPFAETFPRVDRNYAMALLSQPPAPAANQAPPTERKAVQRKKSWWHFGK